MRRALALAAVALVTACGAGTDVAEPAGVTVLGASVGRAEPAASDEELHRLTRAQLEFATDLYREVAADEPGDLAIGPGSLHTALAMVRAGARGQTAAEMDDVLHTAELGDDLHALGNALDTELRSRDADRGVRLGTANRVWVDEGLELREDYVDVLAGSYGAALASLDIAADPEAARTAVNQWVADATLDRIEELFPAGTIDSDTQMVLANALHLDAHWKFPFPPDRTTPAPFVLPDGTSVDVETMHYDEYLPSGRGPGWTAVRLPYDGEQLSMTVIVPDDLSAFEQALDADALEAVRATIKDGGIHLSLPRFTARTHLSLRETLPGLGMPTAFGAGADFSGMTGSPGLFLGPVEHEVVVEVDEQGTEAAAASGVGMLGSHGPTVTVDRPFLFTVEDDATGAVLFLGRVTDPR